VPQGFPFPLPVSIIISTHFLLLSEEMYLFSINDLESYFMKSERELQEHHLKLHQHITWLREVITPDDKTRLL
jgi:hypothetical protein